MNELETANINNLYDGIVELIETTKTKVVRHVNAELVELYWGIGEKIQLDTLKNDKPEYGKAVLEEISKRLSFKYGRGYSRSNISRMIRFHSIYEDFSICATLSHKLSWSHFIELLKIENSIKREFYTTMTINEHWDVRTLRERIDSAMFERTAISKKPEQTIINELDLLRDKGKMTTDLFFRDPYNLDFLNLKDTYSEKDLESTIIAELEKFVLEMGTDFAFMGKQKRITIDGQDFYIDLLFYHRKLKRLVVIELKLEKFKPEHKGQVELYLKWLDRYEKLERRGITNSNNSMY